MCEPAIIKKLFKTVNQSSGETIKKKPRILTTQQTADVLIELSRSSPLEEFKNVSELGRFTLRSQGETIGAGIITKVQYLKNQLLFNYIIIHIFNSCGRSKS